MFFANLSNPVDCLRSCSDSTARCHRCWYRIARCKLPVVITAAVATPPAVLAAPSALVQPLLAASAAALPLRCPHSPAGTITLVPSPLSFGTSPAPVAAELSAVTSSALPSRPPTARPPTAAARVAELEGVIRQMKSQQQEFQQTVQLERNQHCHVIAKMQAVLERMEQQRASDNISLLQPRTVPNKAGGYGHVWDSTIGHSVPIAPTQQRVSPARDSL